MCLHGVQRDNFPFHFLIPTHTPKWSHNRQMVIMSILQQGGERMKVEQSRAKILPRSCVKKYRQITISEVTYTSTTTTY